MANHNEGDLSNLFSAVILYPASRSVELQFTKKLQPRNVPDAYRPSSTSDQSCGNLEQQRTVISYDDEMQAVQRSYTARIGDQELPSSAREMYRLVASMAADALSGKRTLFAVWIGIFGRPPWTSTRLDRPLETD